jgi:RHS repeat-associated protein
MTAGNGEVVWSAKYNSFGEAEVEVETIENNLRFPGQYEDTETGLYYNWNRYYDTETGRYNRTDPLSISKIQLLKQNYRTSKYLNKLYKYSQETPSVQNQYLYVINNPNIYSDHSGNIIFCATAAAGYLTYTAVYAVGDLIFMGAVWMATKYIAETRQPPPLPPYRPGPYEQCMNRCKIKRCDQPIMRKLCYLKCFALGGFDIFTGL